MDRLCDDGREESTTTLSRDGPPYADMPTPWFASGDSGVSAGGKSNDVMGIF